MFSYTLIPQCTKCNCPALRRAKKGPCQGRPHRGAPRNARSAVHQHHAPTLQRPLDEVHHCWQLLQQVSITAVLHVHKVMPGLGREVWVGQGLGGVDHALQVDER